MSHLNAVKTLGMSRSKWLELRKSGIGGSDIAAIMGLSKYATAYDVYKSKVAGGNEVDDESEAEYKATSNSDNMNEAAYWGNLLEDTIAKEFAKRNDLDIQNVNFMLRHPSHQWAIANIDKAVINPNISKTVRIKGNSLTTDTILEVKMASTYMEKEWGDENSDEIPHIYQCQTQWYLGVTGARYCYVAVLVGGNKYRQFLIERNNELIDTLFSVAKDFWENHIMTKNPPKPTSLQNAKDAWARHNPETCIEVDSESEAAKLVSQYRALKEEEKQTSSLIEDLKTQIACLFEDNETLLIDGKAYMTYKAQQSNRFDDRSFKKDHPELAEKYMKSSEHRVLRMKKIKAAAK